MSCREPLPRRYHAAVGIGRNFYIWGGERSARVQSKTFHSFDILSVTWEEPQQFTGSVPDRLYGMAVCTDGGSAFAFGGMTDNWVYSNRIYEMNPVHSTLRELLPANSRTGSRYCPEAKCGSGIVQFNQELVVYGGYGAKGRTDELHVFDLRNRVWAIQPTTGDKPPPLCDHTFTKIDHHRAVVIGGETTSGYLNDTYVLDMKTWCWTKMNIPGDKPPTQYYHDTCCITSPLTGQHNPLLMVVGGVGSYYYGDVWLLDVDKEEWSELTLPIVITPRCGHSAVIFGNGPSFRVLVLFGGENPVHNFISETTLLLLELRGGSWQVTRVVKPDELGKLDKCLTELMKKLELSPQEGVTSGVEQSLRKEKEMKAGAERQVLMLEQNVSELQIQSTITDGAASSANKGTLSPTQTKLLGRPTSAPNI